MSARQPLRVGLVGCGRLAELGYLPALAGLKQVELVAVADPVAGRRDRIAAHASALRTRPRAHGSVGELVAAGDVDALVIASPAVEHLHQAELAAEAGLPALVEKPPAPALDEAERLAALSPAPWIGFNRRFQHGAPLLGRLPAEGPLELELELDYRRRSWRPLVVNEEVLTDIVPHLVDLALVLSGVDGARVSAARISHDRAQLELDTGRGRARIRCASDRPHRERVRARGEGGRRLAASGSGGPVAALTSRLPGRAHPLVQSLRDQLSAFAEAIRGGSPGLLASAADGARVMRVIDEARRVAAASPGDVICVLQFDAASVAALERLLAAGRLPNLAALTERGTRLELDTPATDFAAGAFYTLYSGVELGDHGVFYPFQWSAAEQRARYATAFEAPPAVWERLARSGLRTLAIDPYESRPPQHAHGTFVCGWGFADRVVLPRWSRPPEAGRRFERRFGRGPQATEIFGRPRARDLLALREKLRAAPARIATLAEELLASERFDLAWLTFSAAHLAGHQFWDLSQLDAEALDPEARGALEGALADVYGAVDGAIGRVVSALPDGTDVIVTSAVGMDVNTSLADLLPSMLARVLASGPLDNGGSGAIWRLRAAMPARLRGAIAAAVPDRAALELTARLELRGLDWATTRAFAHPADNQGYVRLNLRGRERAGIVDPGEAEALLGEIAAGLATFRRPDGEPAVSSTVRAADLYPGRYSERLPDLVVRWSERPATRVASVSSDRFGEVRREGAGSGRSGNHTPGDAWALVVGGASEFAEPLRAPRLVDVAATVCEVTGADRTGLPGEPLLSRAG